MEPKFQTSFIPKKPVDSSPKDYLYKPASGGIFFTIGTVLFIVALLLCGGLFFYEKMINDQITAANEEITASRGDFEEETIKEIINYNNQMGSAQQILNNHIIIYPLLEQLEINTYRNIGFTNLDYLNTNGKITIKSNIVSKSYNSLAQQSLKFRENNYMINPVFSDLSLNEDGNVTAIFTSDIKNELFSYRKSVEELNSNQ